MLVIESYITHIRVTEDAAFPSSPAAPNSPPENKKPRVIIVAVRKSGRVRMHKARENGDGTFSIGKTWMLDDLARIQTYEHLTPSSPAEQQQKQWASNVGFVVTITKPYYWQSDTPKERDFFIGSLVKIYKKYTGGKLPELVGFDSRDREILSGGAPGGPKPVKAPKPPEPSPARPDPRVPRSRSPSAQRNLAQSPRSNRAPSQDGPRETRKQPSREQFMRKQPSQEQMQRMRPPFSPAQPLQTPPSRDGVSSKPLESPMPVEYTPPTSFSESTSKKWAPDNRNNQPLDSSTKMPTPNESSGIPRSIPPPSEDRPSSRDRLKLKLDFEPISPLEQLNQRFSPQDKPTDASFEILRRSPGGSKGSTGQKSLRTEPEENFVTPPSYVEPSRTESRGVDKFGRAFEESSSRQSAGLAPLTKPSGPGESPILPSTSPSAPEIQPVISITESDTSRRRESAEPAPLQIGIRKMPTSPPSEDEEMHRPGLGPMVKKKGGIDLANTFRKAATAYGAFKPRAGGAAERLMAAKERADNEPDGITGVVPAPFLRVQPSEATKGASPQNITPQETPKFQITDMPTESKPAEVAPRKKQPISPMPRPEPREDNTAQYCNALGIDPSILQGRGVEFDHILSDLGWDGKLKDDKTAVDFEADIRREIGRVQASSWLDHLETHDAKVNELAHLLDRAIEECEELDGLLTLYSHELSVCDPLIRKRTCLQMLTFFLDTGRRRRVYRIPG